MKNNFLLCLLLSAITSTGQPPGAITTFSPELIPGMERKAMEGRQHAMTRQYSVASENFDVSFYRCEWEIDPAIRYIKGNVTSRFRITSATNAIVFDLHIALKVDSVLYRGGKAVFQHAPNNALTIMFPQTLNAGQRDSVTVFYQGIPANEGQGSFTNSQQGGIPVMWTLSEPYGAKDWWPCKSGLNDKADSIDILVTQPDRYRSSSNGVLVRSTSINEKRTDYWKHRYPIASYLVAIAVTNYVTYENAARVGDVTVPVRMYAYPSHADYFREPTRIASVFLELLSTLFGPYPFSRESYSQTQFGLNGGIEHQTNSFIGSNWNQLVVHELAHQWFGDKVTCASWTDIWLNEGFAQYMQFIYVEQMEPQNKVLHLDVYRKMVVDEPSGSVKVTDTSNSNRIFDGRLTYAKGSFLVHMIRWRLGDALFYRALQKYLDDSLLAYGIAATPDLERNLEEISGQDFTEFFKDWYEGQGHPSYQLLWSLNKNNQVKVKLNQTSSHPSVSFFEMPVPVQLKGEGRDTIVTLNHTQSGQVFWLDPGFTVTSVIFDPEIWLLSDRNTVTKLEGVSDYNNDIVVYPGPAGFYISIKNPTVKSLSIQLFNAAGQLLLRKEALLGARDEIVEVPSVHLPAGLYLLKMQGEGINIVKQVLK